jgi:hypothetical protein
MSDEPESAGGLPPTITMKRRELHHASVCVALVYGALGGVLAGLTGWWWLAPILGFAIAWVVCERAFPSAHAYYGDWSVYHILYNLIAAGAGLGSFFAIARL